MNSIFFLRNFPSHLITQFVYIFFAVQAKILWLQILPRIQHSRLPPYFNSMFRTLLYSSLWYILKNKHIQNPTEYLRWRVLLRTLCNYSMFRCPIYSKNSLIQNASLSATPSSISCHWSLSIPPENIRKSLVF